MNSLAIRLKLQYRIPLIISFCLLLLLIVGGGTLEADDAPGIPTNLTAAKTANGIRLSWSAPEGEVTGYRILRRRPTQGEGSLKRYVGDTGSSATSYTDTNVSIDAELYIYRVLTLRGDLKSARSERVMIEVGPGDFGTSAQPAATPMPPPSNTPVPPPSNTPVPPPSNTPVPPPPTNTPLPTATPLPPPTPRPVEQPVQQRSVIENQPIQEPAATAIPAVATPEMDRAALVALYKAMNGNNWTNKSNWLSVKPLDEWHGVSASSGRVRALNLARNNLSGSIPSSISNLGGLLILQLQNNSLSGSIPSSLGDVDDLVLVQLDRNQLSGSIPSSLGNLTDLQHLTLDYNLLSGSIPSQLGNLANLRSLYLSDNRLSGAIPEALAGLTRLAQLYLAGDNHNFTGCIPAAVAALTSSNDLADLGIPSCAAPIPTATPVPSQTPTSTAPPTFSPSPPAQPRSVNENQPILEQQIVEPAATATLAIARQHGTTATHTPEPTSTPRPTATPEPDRAALVSFYYAMNGTNWRNQRNWLSNNPIREWYGVTASNSGIVKGIWLRNNDLSGRLPSSLGNLSSLEDLNLTQNDLSGSIPSQLGNLSDLVVLDLSYNNLSGSIPSSLGNQKLVILKLQHNNLSGSIPSTLGNGISFQHIYLNNNNLSGSIPSTLGYYTVQLQWLYLQENNLSGSIPSNLGDLPSIQRLDLSDNNLSGSVPSALKKLDRLNTLRLRDNNFSGCLPPGLAAGVATNDLSHLGLSVCMTPTPTITPTIDPSLPTATARPPSPNIYTFAEDRSIGLGWNLGGTKKVKVFWRRQGSSSYQSTNFIGKASSSLQGNIYILDNLLGDTTYQVYIQGYSALNQQLGRSAIRTVKTLDLAVRNVRLVPGERSLQVSWTPPSTYDFAEISWRREAGGQEEGVSGVEGNSYTITGLDGGEYYLVSVAAYYGRLGKYTSPVRARTQAGAVAPSSVSAPQLSLSDNNRQIEVTWSRPNVPADSLIRKYELRVYNSRTDKYDYVTHVIDPVTQAPATSTQTVSIRDSDTLYRVAVRSFANPGDWSEWSGETSITSEPDPDDISLITGPPGRPGTPTLSIDDTDPLNPLVGVTWTVPTTDSRNPVTYYQLQFTTHLNPEPRVFNFEPPEDADEVVLDPPAVKISQLRTRVHYYISVRARNLTGFGPWSTVSHIYLVDNHGNLTPHPTTVAAIPGFVPGAPTNFTTDTVADNNSAYVRIQWDEPSYDGNRGIEAYKVRYRSSGVDWEEHTIEASGSAGFLLGGGRTGVGTAVRGTRYEFQVAAINEIGQGNWSRSVYATPLLPPDAPDEPTHVAGDGWLRVSWTRPASNDRSISHYQLFYAEAARNSTDDGTTIERITGTSYTISGLTNGTEYKVTVRAVSSAGIGTWSVYENGTPG